MAYIGPSFARVNKNDILTFKFTITVADVPTTLTTPTVKAYEEGNATEFTGGITLNVDYDGKTGLHELIVDTSNAAYSAGKNYDFFFSAGSAGAVTLIGTGFFHLATIPDPADLRMVNGGSTGATASVLELKRVSVDNDTTDPAVHVRNSAGKDAVYLEVAGDGNGNPLDLYTAGFSAAIWAESAAGSATVFRSSADGSAAWVVQSFGAGAVALEVTSDLSHALELIPGGTGKAINALGQVSIAPTNTDDDALVITGNGDGAAVKAYSTSTDATIDIGHGVGPTGSTVKIEGDNADPTVAISNSSTGDVIDLAATGGKCIDAALAELPQGVPPVNPSIDEALMIIYMALRNQLKVDKGTLLKQIYNDAGTRIAKKAISDDGTIYTEGKMSSGA